MARAYAAERVSMGKTIDKHELIADYLDEMENTVAGLRAICVDAGVSEELAQRKRLRLMYAPPEDAAEKQALEREVKALAWQSRLNTPLLKYLAAEARRAGSAPNPWQYGYPPGPEAASRLARAAHLRGHQSDSG